MFCKYCGKENNDEAKFCKYCGQMIEHRLIFCQFCKKEIDEEAEKCPYCFKIIKEKTVQNKEVKSEVVEEKNKGTQEEEPFNCAGFWIRFGAWFIDIGIITILFLLFILFVLWDEMLWGKNLDTLITFIVIIVYHTFFLSIYSSTPGKMLYGLEVIDLNTKEKIKFGKALERSLSYIVSSFIFSLGFLWIAFDKEKHQGWHDKIAKTTVIRRRKKKLFIPIILTIVSLVFLYWIIVSEDYYDIPYFYDYLGKDSEIMYLIDKKIESQPFNLCCFYATAEEFSKYVNEIPPLILSDKTKSGDQIFKELNNAAVVIGTELAFGSGFIISPFGLIVTNYHVIEDASKIVVAVNINNKDIKIFDVATIVAENPLSDIAVLKINAQNLVYIYMGNSDLVVPGQKVYAIGNPEGYRNTISDGIISQKRDFSGIEHFQITNPISGGSSGGVLINERGEAIGITNMISLYGQNLNFAVPINYVKEILEIEEKEFFHIEKEDRQILDFTSNCNLQKAKGVITVYSKWDSPQILVATTRFVSEQGIIFRIDERVLIPAFGQITVSVTANDIGPEYEIGPSTFSIPGFAGTERYNAFYGKSFQSMSCE